MTEDQVKHITNIIQDFKSQGYAKYSRGTVEHQGNLWEVPLLKLLEYALEEAIDQFVYIHTAYEKEKARLRELDKKTNLAKLHAEVSKLPE